MPTVVRVRTRGILGPALESGGVRVGRPILVLIGGAAGLPSAASAPLAALLSQHLIPTLEKMGAAVVDGGTDAGVMRLMGDARTAAAASFPLVGVAAEATVRLDHSDFPVVPDAAAIEPGHTLIALVPGTQWGDESPWLAATATAIAAGEPTVTLLINGGTITLADAQHSLSADRPLIVAEGTGRAADEIARARRGESDDFRARLIADSPLTQLVSIERPDAIAEVIRRHLSGADGD